MSTADQDLAFERDALERAGCVRIFTDTASGKLSERPGMSQALDYLRTGDTLTVWKLDRPGRSLQHLIAVVNPLEERGAAFRPPPKVSTSRRQEAVSFFMFSAAWRNLNGRSLSEAPKLGLRRRDQGDGRVGADPCSVLRNWSSPASCMPQVVHPPRSLALSGAGAARSTGTSTARSPLVPPDG